MARTGGSRAPAPARRPPRILLDLSAFRSKLAKTTRGNPAATGRNLTMAAPKPLPSQDELRTTFEYRDGALRWRKRTGNRAAGSVAGGRAPADRYARVRLGKCTFLVHRIVYALVHGVEPPGIDHIDGDPDNNRVENLRPANQTQNNHNRRLQKSNTSGYRGVCFNKRDGKFVAHIRVNKGYKHLGSFDDALSASNAYEKAAKAIHGEFYRPSGATHG